MTSSLEAPYALLEARHTPSRLAAVLVDRREPRHELLVTVDPTSGEVLAKLFAGQLEASGRGPAVMHFPTVRTCSIVTTIDLRGLDAATGSPRSVEACVALTWAGDDAPTTFDVAGTALLHQADNGCTHRFEVLAGHPFNRCER